MMGLGGALFTSLVVLLVLFVMGPSVSLEGIITNSLSSFDSLSAAGSLSAVGVTAVNELGAHHIVGGGG